MSVPAPNRNYSTESVLIAVFSMAALLVHLLTNGRYGYFRDELYYIACGRHLDFGYVDQPPLSILLLRLSQLLLGGLSTWNRRALRLHIRKRSPQIFADQFGWEQMVGSVRMSIIICSPRMKNAPRFFAKTMARLERSISSGRSSGCHQPFPGIRIIFCGDLAIGQAKLLW